MRIALVIAGAGIGGTERHVELLLAGLVARGHEVRLVASEEGRLLESARRIQAEAVVIPRSNAPSYSMSLLQELRRFRPQILHSHSGRLPCIAGRGAGVPAIVDTRHGLIVPSLGTEPGSNARWRWEAAKCRLAHATILLSSRDEQRLVLRGGLPADRTHVIYNGVPAPTSAPAAERGEQDLIRLGFIGRLSKEKRPHRLFDLLQTLLAPSGPLKDDERERLSLDVVGDGPLRAELEDRAETQGLRKRVRFHGWMDDVEPVLRRMGILLLPSATEGMPYTLLEAMAAGTLFLATPVGGVPELVGPQLVESLVNWDEEEWTAGVTRLLRDPSHRRICWEAGQARAADLSVERMVEETVRVYDQVLGRSL